MDELKPCPFCGAGASREFFTQEAGWSIFCDGCHASAATLPSRPEAETAWNTRTSSQEVAELVGLLREATVSLRELAETADDFTEVGLHEIDRANEVAARIDAALSKHKGAGQ